MAQYAVVGILPDINGSIKKVTQCFLINPHEGNHFYLSKSRVTTLSLGASRYCEARKLTDDRGVCVGEGPVLVAGVGALTLPHTCGWISHCLSPHLPFCAPVVHSRTRQVSHNYKDTVSLKYHKHVIQFYQSIDGTNFTHTK